MKYYVNYANKRLEIQRGSWFGEFLSYFRESAIRGWYLMNYCLGVFGPSQEFTGFLSKYLDDAAVKPGDDQINTLAQTALKRQQVTSPHLINFSRKFL